MGDRFPSAKGRATISDVARAAGVSKATVSKYLNQNGNYYVAAATRQRIEDAIHALRFEPNAVARGLANSRTLTIGVVVASLRNPFYPDLVAGIEEVVEPAGYTLLLGSTESSAGREANIVKSMVNRQVDGVVMASVRMKAREISHIRKSGLHVVLASRDLPGAPADTVVIDNVLGGRLAVRHLLEHGHNRIAHIAGPQDVMPFRDRLKGFQEEMAATCHDVTRELVPIVGSDQDSGARALNDLLDLADPPTAVFVGNDTMALGVLEACAARGIVIPADLAVIGFDNIWVGRLAGMSLSTVDSQARLIGRSASGLLLDRLRARGPSDGADAQRVTLAPDLVIRGSCGCDSGE